MRARENCEVLKGEEGEGAEDVAVAPGGGLREEGLQLGDGRALARARQALQHQHAPSGRRVAERSHDLGGDRVRAQTEHIDGGDGLERQLLRGWDRALLDGERDTRDQFEVVLHVPRQDGLHLRLGKTLEVLVALEVGDHQAGGDVVTRLEDGKAERRRRRRRRHL
jgi:hypothetical protein